MRHYFVFDGRSSADFGVYTNGGGTFSAPERDAESVEIPGRNGSLVIDNGRYKNISVEYDCFIVRDFKENLAAFKGALLSKAGFFVLEDTYHPDEYRLARVDGGLSVKPSVTLREGEFTVEFECRPERFLKVPTPYINLSFS